MVYAFLIRGDPGTLKYLDNDIHLITTTLNSIGIKIEASSGKKSEVLSKLGEVADQLSSIDTLIIYYTGHGYLGKGKTWFKLGASNKTEDSMSVDALMDTVSNAKTNKIVYIFDCCYAAGTAESWKKYADDKHLLFLPSNKLEEVAEVEEYQASFFTYCIYKALESKSEILYENGKITLKTLYDATKANAIQYNKEKSATMPLPELFGGLSKDVTIGYKTVNDEDSCEEIVQGYLNDFINCVQNCEKLCIEEQKWCSTIIRTDAKIYQFVIPSVKEFLISKPDGNISKLNAFFDNWFTMQDNYLGILGDMGVGKTTACIYLFYYLAKKYIEKVYTYVPVYFSLDGINQYLAKRNDVYNTIKSFMSDKFSIDLVRKLCEQRRMVFILDGFDEISGDASIATIMKNYDILKPLMRFECKTVLTCRTHYFSEQEQLEEVLTGKTHGTDFAAKLLNDEYPFNMVELQEFTEDEILELLRLLLPNEDNKKIWKSIGEIYDLRDLAKRAILLKMIVRTLPELRESKHKIDSATLYMLYTQKLLKREIQSRKIGLELSEKENFIAYIANLMFTNDQQLTIQTKRFDKEIRNYFRGSIYSRDDLNNYNYDCKVSTFFSRDPQDNYRFMHKSFYEYYFSLYCVRQMGESNFQPWEDHWFPREIARFIKELLSNSKYSYLIPKVIETSLSTDDRILIWNTLHVLSLLDNDVIGKYLTKGMMQEYVNKGRKECRCVIIRQYCRIIAKFIDRQEAESLIEKILNIVKTDSAENDDNDFTYYNYYGGKNAACQAFITHLAVSKPKYDAKLHLYLLEHLASQEYSEKIQEATDGWENREDYLAEIGQAIAGINARAEQYSNL